MHYYMYILLFIDINAIRIIQRTTHILSNKMFAVLSEQKPLVNLFTNNENVQLRMFSAEKIR